MLMEAPDEAPTEGLTLPNETPAAERFNAGPQTRAAAARQSAVHAAGCSYCLDARRFTIRPLASVIVGGGLQNLLSERIWDLPQEAWTESARSRHWHIHPESGQ